MSKKLAFAFHITGLSLLAVILANTATESQVQSRQQRKCIVAMNKAYGRVANAQARVHKQCIKLEQAGKLAPELVKDCMLSDPRGKVAKAMQKTHEAEAKHCTVPPDFGFSDADTVNAAAVIDEQQVLFEMFGANINDVIVTKEEDPYAARCLTKMIRGVERLEKKKRQEFLKCKRDGLRSGTITSEVELSTICFQAMKDDVRQTIVKPAEWLERTFLKKCAGTTSSGDPVQIDQVFPGRCAGTIDAATFTQCADEFTDCRVCISQSTADGITTYDCDTLDDLFVNGSCFAVQCGNGIVEINEDCDDGNTDDGDCCSSTCTFEPVASLCDDGNVCTDNECDGAGTCLIAANNSDPCDDGLFCNGADTCSGGTCSVHAGDPCAAGTECANDCNETADNCLDPVGATCGDASDTECTNPDSCDGAGNCLDNHEASGFSCGDTGTECIVQDTCDGAGACTDNGFVASGTSCGDASDTECTNPDTCDGAGACQDNHEATGFACGDAGTECIVQDTCDGAGACDDNGFVSSGTSCGDGSDTECTNPDTCDGAGACQDNHEATGFACGDAGTECIVQDTCDGAGACDDNGFVSSGTSCGDGSDTECTNPDTCDGAGACLDNHEASGFNCGDTGTECIVQDTCDGAGACSDNGFVSSGTSCGDGSDTECTNPDTCDGAGACQDNHEASGFNCGDAGTECIVQDTCDGAGACSDNGFESSGTSCGDTSDTECTNPDTCDGAGACQDNHEASGFNCGDTGTECIVQDTCDGAGACSDNGFVSSGTSCGDGSDTECTNPDTCDGAGACQDNHEASGFACGDAGTECIVQDTCDGAGACSDNGFVSSGTSCGDGSDTECTNPDTCDGAGACQDNHEANGFACGDAGTECIVQDTCDGAGACSDNGFVSSGTSCGDGSDTECTNPDTCDGAGACQDNHEASGFACGDTGTECIVQDTCDGAGACSDNGFVSSGTSCGDGSDTECTNPDTCDGAGACQDNHEASGFACGDAGTECIVQDTCDGAGACSDNGFVSSGTSCGDGSDTECTNPDTCDGAGACQDNHEANGFACGDAGTECIVQDTCDGAGACSDNGFVSSGTSCGDGSDTECTNPDTCDGAGACQDNHEALGFNCGDTGTECVVQDTCDGAGACSDNGFFSAGTSCGDGSDTECTNPDTCNGAGACQDNHEASGFACGDAGTACVVQDTCNGAGTCTDNGFFSAGTSCGDPSNTECTNPDTCDGAGSCQDNHASAGAACGDPGSECVLADSCNGAGACTDNGFVSSGTACGDGSDTECTNPDTCDGAGACQDNHEASGFACGDTGTACVVQDTCNGGGTCTDNGFFSAGTSCGDPSNTDCTNPDTCDGSGTCLDNHATTGTACVDGLFCNGADACLNGTCAMHAGDPCVGGGQCNEVCNEAADNCFDPSGTVCDAGAAGMNDACDVTADTCNGSGTCVNSDPAATAELCYVAGDEDCDGNADYLDTDTDSVCATNGTETCLCSDACEIRAITPSFGSSTSLAGTVPFSSTSAGSVSVVRTGTHYGAAGGESLDYTFTGVPANLTLWWGLDESGATPPLHSVSDPGAIDEFAGAALYGTGAGNFVEYQRSEAVTCFNPPGPCPGTGTVRLEMTTTGNNWDELQNVLPITALEPPSLETSANTYLSQTAATEVSGSTLSIGYTSTFNGSPTQGVYDPAPTNTAEPFAVSFSAQLFGSYRNANVCQ